MICSAQNIAFLLSYGLPPFHPITGSGSGSARQLFADENEPWRYGQPDQDWLFVYRGATVRGQQMNPGVSLGYNSPCDMVRAAAAIVSAVEMMKERNRTRTLNGLQPASYNSANIGKLGPDVSFLWFDAAQSYLQFKEDDLNEQQGKEYILRYTSKDGIAPISPEEIQQKLFGANLIDQKERDRELISNLAGTGLTQGQIRGVSEQTATDPVSGLILSGIIDSFLPKETIASIAIKDPSLPADEYNRLTSDEEAARIAYLMGNRLRLVAEYYRNQEGEYEREQAQSRDYLYWSENYPYVELREQDNQHILPLLTRSRLADFLLKTYPGSQPIVNVRFTQRTKPKPELSWLAKNASWLGPLLSVIPIVGAVATSIVTIGSTSDMRHYSKEWEIPLSQFHPQYEPQSFLAPLPLNEAQYLVTNPQYGPALVKRFQDRLNGMQFEQFQAAMRSLAVIPPEASNNTIDPVDTPIARIDQALEDVNRVISDKGLVEPLTSNPSILTDFRGNFLYDKVNIDDSHLVRQLPVAKTESSIAPILAVGVIGLLLLQK